jgi:hypothetical protein
LNWLSGFYEILRKVLAKMPGTCAFTCAFTCSGWQSVSVCLTAVRSTPLLNIAAHGASKCRHFAVLQVLHSYDTEYNHIWFVCRRHFATAGNERTLF